MFGMSSLDVPPCWTPDRAISGRVDVACYLLGRERSYEPPGWMKLRTELGMNEERSSNFRCIKSESVQKKEGPVSKNRGYKQGRRVVE